MFTTSTAKGRGPSSNHSRRPYNPIDHHQQHQLPLLGSHSYLEARALMSMANGYMPLGGHKRRTQSTANHNPSTSAMMMTERNQYQEMSHHLHNRANYNKQGRNTSKMQSHPRGGEEEEEEGPTMEQHQPELEEETKLIVLDTVGDKSGENGGYDFKRAEDVDVEVAETLLKQIQLADIVIPTTSQVLNYIANTRLLNIRRAGGDLQITDSSGFPLMDVWLKKSCFRTAAWVLESYGRTVMLMMDGERSWQLMPTYGSLSIDTAPQTSLMQVVSADHDAIGFIILGGNLFEIRNFLKHAKVIQNLKSLPLSILQESRC